METFNVSKMATVSNAAIAHLRDVQAIEKLEKDSNILYDLFDLEKIFKVTKRQSNAKSNDTSYLINTSNLIMQKYEK